MIPEKTAAMQGSAIPRAGKVFSLFVNGAEDPSLRAGELVTAEVLRAGPYGAATIRLKNAVVETRTAVPLQKGDTLTLRVERQENTIHLRLGGDAPDQQARSVTRAPLSAFNSFEGIKPGLETLARLTALLLKLPESLRQNLPEIEIIRGFLLEIDDLSGKTVKDAVQNGGVFFETKLRILALGLEADGAVAEIGEGRIIANDLKASLLRLKDTLLAPAFLERLRSSLDPDDLLSAVNAALRSIEFYQLQSKLSDSLRFFLPLLWKQLRDGEIIVREYDPGRPDELSYACTMSLDLEQAGKIRVLLVYQAGAIRIACAAGNEHFSRLFREGVDVLEERFRSSGLRLGHCAVYHEPEQEFSRTPAAAGFSITM